MTLKELFSVQADLNKLKSLSMELANLEEFNPYRNNVITDMPKGGQGKDVTAWYIEEKERLRGKIKTYEEKLRRDRAKVEAFIAAAPHPESEIIRYRVINDLSWDDIGAIVGYSRSWVSKVFYRYIKKTEKTESSLDSRARV
ncbi:MAG: hypothetical protein E7J97_22775 [Citrobacter sp.]|uniref:hypothetical protein n=1 Tax=Faecalicatena contorta TaxID=39482 RepID=UPI00129E276B|nr:hypothetical protein [Faecalicatena contorta]MDU7723516.1 hypothetical protein [Citrobacter sp.]MRM89653.1 hypothetical protein [Faecalicatena contorta]